MKNIKIFKKSFEVSVPILFGYVGAGFAFGLLARKYELSIIHTLMMSTFIYAGGMQYIALELFRQKISFVSLMLITLFMNIRHVAYGIAMLTKYREIPVVKKIYLIFGLTDETFAVLQGDLEFKLSLNEKYKFYFIVTLLNQLYWILGSLLGRIVGEYIKISLEGAEFALVALFMIIFIEQWESNKSHLPAILGILSSVIILLFDRSSSMITYSILFFIFIILIIKKKIELNKDLFGGE